MAYTLCGLFKAIADKIREKTGTTDTIPAKEFPKKITEMGRDIFAEIATGTITKIEASDIDGLELIGDFSFAYCESLESITIPSSVIYITSNAFVGCTNLKTINVPWAEGEISNAPWGASNATINYNYGGE